jgi:hypothetical protein
LLHHDLFRTFRWQLCETSLNLNPSCNSPGIQTMHLTNEEQAMLAGELGPAKQWAINHQIKVGTFFDAAEMVAVSQAHMMADPESVGDAGVRSTRRRP